MRKRFLGLLVLIVLLLSACSAAEQVPASETSTPTAEPQPTQTAIIKEDPTETSPTETAASAPGGISKGRAEMECTLVSDQPDAPAEYVAIFGVKENDWVKGPENAAVTFVEYGDFQ